MIVVIVFVVVVVVFEVQLGRKLTFVAAILSNIVCNISAHNRDDRLADGRKKNIVYMPNLVQRTCSIQKIEHTYVVIEIPFRDTSSMCCRFSMKHSLAHTINLLSTPHITYF